MIDFGHLLFILLLTICSLPCLLDFITVRALLLHNSNLSNAVNSIPPFYVFIAVGCSQDRDQQQKQPVVYNMN